MLSTCFGHKGTAPRTLALMASASDFNRAIPYALGKVKYASLFLKKVQVAAIFQ